MSLLHANMVRIGSMKPISTKFDHPQVKNINYLSIKRIPPHIIVTNPVNIIHTGHHERIISSIKNKDIVLHGVIAVFKIIVSSCNRKRFVVIFSNVFLLCVGKDKLRNPDSPLLFSCECVHVEVGLHVEQLQPEVVPGDVEVELVAQLLPNLINLKDGDEVNLKNICVLCFVLVTIRNTNKY